MEETDSGPAGDRRGDSLVFIHKIPSRRIQLQEFHFSKTQEVGVGTSCDDWGLLCPPQPQDGVSWTLGIPTGWGREPQRATLMTSVPPTLPLRPALTWPPGLRLLIPFTKNCGCAAKPLGHPLPPAHLSSPLSLVLPVAGTSLGCRLEGFASPWGRMFASGSCPPGILYQTHWSCPRSQPAVPPAQAVTWGLLAEALGEDSGSLDVECLQQSVS